MWEIKCNFIDCNNHATKEVRLQLAVNDKHEPAISTPIMYVCDCHAADCTFGYIIGDRNWENICARFESIGRMRPRREFSKLIIQPISNEHHTNSSLS